jgi:hypothetical protein
MNMTGFIPTLLSLAGLAVLSAPGGADAPSQAAPQQMRMAAAGIGPSDELAGGERAGSEGASVATPAAPDSRPIDVRNLRITRELPVERWLEPGEFVWDAEAAAGGQGETIVVVNLRSRTLSAYKNGVEIGRSHILYGHGAHPTPLGTFPVMEKKRHHRSRTYNNAPMPHMMRLTSDGVALHGSPELADDVVTHGCIGMPEEFAGLLFAHVRVGDRVVIWSGRGES